MPPIRSRRALFGRTTLAAVSVLTVTAMVAGCDSGTEPTTSSGTSSSSAAPSEDAGQLRNPNGEVAMPLPDNAVDDAVGKLDGLVESMMNDTKIPGMAVAVVHGGKTVYAKGFGVAEVGTDRKVDADTVFPLASVSKSIGSTVLAKLIADKTIAWDTPVTQNLPAFALGDPWVTQHVTIADMYTHRSGLPDHAGDKLEELGYSRAEILARLRYMPLEPFRITSNYTNFGITAAAESAARKAGTDWETLSQNTIYGPLGMTNTSSRFSDFEARPDRVVGHVQVDGKWVKTPEQRDPDAQSPAGGVSSSVNDMTRWLTMVLAGGKYDGNQVVGEEALTEATTPQMISDPAASPEARAGFYGYGFNVSVTSAGRTTFSHAGAFSLGAGTDFLVMPSADVGIVVLSNAAPIGAVDALCGEFIDTVQFSKVTHDWRALYGAAYASQAKPSGSLVGQQPPANPAPPQPLSTYAGTYQNRVYGPVAVREENGKLVLALGPGGMTTHELTHWDGNTFTYPIRTENAELGSIAKVTFTGPRMTIDYYADETSDGVFTRS
ncbi:serine hydrolase [Gordonia sp. NPDC003424]